MAKKKPNSKSPLIGRWLIVSTTESDEDYVNEEVRAFFEFEPIRRGQFHFGYVRGGIEYPEVERDGRPTVEFSWDCNDKMAPAQGRGWAVLVDERLKGMIFLHKGDESEFEAERDVVKGDWPWPTRRSSSSAREQPSSRVG